MIRIKYFGEKTFGCGRVIDQRTDLVSRNFASVFCLCLSHYVYDAALFWTMILYSCNALCSEW
jgi:hypothetical protein